MKTSGTELEKSQWRAGTLSLCCQRGLSTQAEFPELGSFLFPLCPTMLCEISAGTGSEHCSFLCSVQRDFPNPWNEHLCRRMNPSDDSRLTTRSAHRNPHVLGKQNTLAQMIERSVSTTDSIFCRAGTVWDISEIIFLLSTPQELKTVLFVSKSFWQRSLCPEIVLRLIFEVMPCCKENASGVCCLFLLHYSQFDSILNYMNYLAATAELNKLTRWGEKEENNSKIIRCYEQCHEKNQCFVHSCICLAYML